MMKKRLSKTLWYGSDIDKEGKPVLPPLAEEANDLEGIHEGELYLHLGDGSALLFTRSADGQVVQLGSNADELANYLLKSVWDKAFEIKTTENGEEYLFTKLNLATQYGITMYANGGLLDLPSIFKGIPFDNKTIWLNPETKLVEVIGSTEEDEGGSADFNNVKESGEGNSFTSFILSEDGKELTFVKGETFAKQSDFASLNTKVADFLEGSDTDNIINKWKELEAFLSGMKESDDLATILSTKWTKDDAKIANWDTAFLWGDHSKVGYLKKEVIYDESIGCWKLEGDLLVTGGITMFANEGKYTPSTITDAVNIDNNTIIRVNGVIMLNPDIEFGGGVADSVAWSDVTGKPTWIGNNKPSYTTSEVTEGTNLYFTNARAVSALSSSLSNYLPLTGGIMTGTIQSQTIRPEASDSYSLGTSSYLWSNVYTKLATIDGIEIKKSASGVLYIGGNLVVSGGITMYGTDGTSAPSIWDGAPKATTTNNENGKGIASFDSKYFSVTNGHVTFIGSTGGGGGKNLNITLPDGSTKVEYNGDAEKSIVLTRLYKSTEVTTATTDEGTITPLAMNTWTTGKFPLKNGTGATGEWNISIKGNAATATKATQDRNGNNIASTYLPKSVASTTYLGINAKAASATSADSATNATNASKVYLTGSSSNSTYRLVFADGASGSNRSLFVDSESDATAGYNPSTNTFVGNGVTLSNGVYASIKTKGWYRFATTINAENEAGGSLIFSIRRQYKNYHTESYVVAVTVGYSGVTFTQLSGKHRSHRSDIASHAMITQVRATNYSDSQVCFDFFYEGTSNEHKVYINCVGTVTLQVPTLTTDVRSYTTVFDLSNGLKVDEIYSNSYRDIAYIRRKFGVNLLTNGDTSISANNYLVGSYQCNSTVVEGRTYRLTFCGKLGEENTYLSLLSNNGNTYIRDMLGLSRTEEKIVSFTFKMKGDQPLRFYQYPNGKFGSYIRWAYLEEAYNEGELITTTDYNNWLAEYNKLDARSFLYKIQRIDVGDSSYWSADKGLNLIDVNEYALTMKRTTSSGGTFIKMFANNQSTQSWASGVNDAHQFSWKYQNGTSDTQKMYLDSSGSLHTKGSYYIDSSDGAGAGYALYSTQNPDMYGILMGTRSSFGTHGGMTGGWATYFCMNGNGEARGWVFRNSYNGTNVASITTSGDMLVNGGITMYSDLRKKTILNHVELSLKEVADAPLIEHYYNSDESKRTHVGSVAQYWAGLNDWFCKEDGEGFLTMEIQNAALASAISVARELTRYESKTDKQIKKLKKRIGELEEEIENLKKV